MPQIIGLNLRDGDKSYGLSLNWDDDAFVVGKISLTIDVSVSDADGEVAVTAASVSIEPPDEQFPFPRLSIRFAGQDPIEINLEELAGEDTIFDGIRPELFGGDPILGCLVRAGLSGVVGQILECKNETTDRPWFWDRYRAIGACLKKNLGRMAARTAWRAGACILGH